jgi:signal transduction histidine kinase/FixJ family two-component response regulator
MTDVAPKSCHVLVVDDEEIVQSLVRDALEDEGLQVLTASNGCDALQILQSNRIDLLITDIRMPNLSGTDLAEQARALNPAIGIIFMTGYASLTSAKDAIQRGALDYIMKPFELAEIRLAVRNGIEKLSSVAVSHEQLTSLSDFSNMLFAAGDRRSLVTSSLRFAMMNLKCERGSVLYYDSDRGEYVMFTDWAGESREDAIGREPLHGMASDGLLLQLHDPILVTSPEEHPVYRQKPDPALRPFLIPPWMTEQDQMIVVPVSRATTFHGLMVFAHNEDTVRIKQTDLKFLSITASQLAISLENLLLLEEAQNAYGRLKELQDETIELEKMATRGVMSAEIGHELNNFLGVVIGNVEMLQHNLNNGHVDKLSKYVDTITATLAKVRSFTENLMDLRSISSKEEIVSIDRLLAEVVEYLRPQKRFREVQILMPPKMESIHFKADVTQIQQLLYNLFHNAADATANCPLREIRVGLEHSCEDDTFHLTMEDTGVGFNPESLAMAFHQQFTTKESGHGFGLMVCRRIIDKHGGKLEIESAPGKGTRLSITFPVASETPAPISVS